MFSTTTDSEDRYELPFEQDYEVTYGGLREVVVVDGSLVWPLIRNMVIAEWSVDKMIRELRTQGCVRHGRKAWSGEYIYCIYSTYWGENNTVH